MDGKEKDQREFRFEGLIVWTNGLRDGELNIIKDQLTHLDEE